MPKKDEIFQTGITDTTNSGHGVARIDGEVVFVQNAADGDFAEIQIIKNTASYSIARINKLIAPSINRIDNNCNAYKSCGGCVFRHITYEHELEVKRKFIENAFHKEGIEILVPAVESGDENAYRSKVQYRFTTDKQGMVQRGMFSESSHNTVCIESCFLEEELFASVIKDLLDIVNRSGMRTYDESTHKGLLRHMLLRSSKNKKISLCLVINSKNHKIFIDTANEIMEKHPEITGFFININREKTNVILSNETIKIKGEETLEETLCGKKFRLGVQSFFQVNRVMAERLYEKAGEYLNPQKDDVILDLYCGVGSIGLSLCGEEQFLTGVEIIPQAVEDAALNAKINGMSENAEFICGDASAGVKHTLKKYGKIDGIIVDPPRKGLSEEVINKISASGAGKIIYISCNPNTMARDIKMLKSKGYVLKALTPFDLFPRTSHVECVAMLKRTD